MIKTTPSENAAASPQRSFAEMAAEERARAKAEAEAPPVFQRPEATKESSEERHSKRKVSAKHYQQATKFQVGSEIDEAGLSAIEFRIYAHLVRRADKNGVCFPSITVICDFCQCERVTAVKAIAVLETRGFISCQKRWHKPTLYKVREARDWCDLTSE